MNKRFDLGTRGIIPANAEESRIIQFILSTFDKDRHGTVLNQDNWKLDNYRLNPIVAYQHTISGNLMSPVDPDYIIGRSISVQVEGTGSGRKLVAAAEFEPEEINPLAEKIFRKVLFGSLSSSSVGFLEIGVGRYGEGDEARGKMNETYYFEGQELLEWSVVNIPSNAHAGKRDAASRMMRELSPAAVAYASRQLCPWNGIRPSLIEAMSVEEVETLFDAKALEIKEKDPVKIFKLLSDPHAKDALIELERAAFRRANPRPSQNNISNQNNFKTIKIKKMKKDYSITKGLLGFSNGQKLDDATRQIHEQGKKDQEDSGLPVRDNVLYLPLEARTVVDTTQPGTELEIQYNGLALGPYLVLAKAGMPILTGLKANQSFPNISGITFFSKGENVSAVDGAGTISGVNFAPKRLTAYLDVSKLWFLQTGDGPNRLLLESIKAAYSAKIESIVLGIAAGSSTVAQGIFYKNTVGKDTKVNAVVPSLTNLLVLEGLLDVANAQSGQLAYITSGVGRRILQAIQRDSGGTKFLLEDEKVNGFPLLFSNSVSDAAGADGLGSGLVFGKFNDLAICQFGALEIELDTLSQAKDYKVRINISGFYDCKGLRGTALTSDDESTDPDNYAVSFQRMAIKAS